MLRYLVAGGEGSAACSNEFEIEGAALKDAFEQKTHARSAAANARYDVITNHGRNAITEADAIAEDP